MSDPTSIALTTNQRNALVTLLHKEAGQRMADEARADGRCGWEGYRHRTPNLGTLKALERRGLVSAGSRGYQHPTLYSPELTETGRRVATRWTPWATQEGA